MAVTLLDLKANHPLSPSLLVHGEVQQTYRREERMKLLPEMLWWVSLRFTINGYRVMDPNAFIRLKGVRTHNLKNLAIDIPLYKFTVVSGVSGSGKSSLVFDTLYGESYRRYLESLSSFARQYLQVLPKPDVDEVTNLPPAIAVRQSRKGASKRSTVASLSEMHDLLQILFAQLAVVSCYKCGKSVQKENAINISRSILEEYVGKKIFITASLSEWHHLSTGDLLHFLQVQGFDRLLHKGEVFRIDDFQNRNLLKSRIIVDRVLITEEFNTQRLLNSLNLAFHLGRGELVLFEPGGFEKRYSQQLKCLECKIIYKNPHISMFSSNNPMGACTLCQGFGNEIIIDWGKVFPDLNSSINANGIAPLNFGKHREFYRHILDAASEINLDPQKKFANFSKDEWLWIKEGDNRKFGGVAAYFSWLDTKKYKAHYRIHKARYTSYKTCSACLGSCFSTDSLSYRLGDCSIADVYNLSITALSDWLVKVNKAYDNGNEEMSIMHNWAMIREAMNEMERRLCYLEKIGLSYLCLKRSSSSLSGGELQRIHLARCLGSSLTDTLFCLDEPTVGLHIKDSKVLLEIICELRDLGNTVVAVEHDATIINGADNHIEIGPEAGEKGGEIYSSLNDPKQQFLQMGRCRKIEKSKVLSLKGSTLHNLKGSDVRIPLGCFVVICGVSGSGKSSLIQHCFYPLALRLIKSPEQDSVREEKLGSLSPLDRVLLKEDLQHVFLVSQIPLGRSSRSNVISYLGIYDLIRKIFASQPEAKKNGLSPGAFSFNIPGGRCETCKGLGRVIEDLSFLGEMDVICQTCGGQRFQENVLDVRYKGKNLCEILEFTVSEAREFFYQERKIVSILDEVILMGLGYITLGQSTSSFSGGEAQRLKLLNIIEKAKIYQACCLIFDEPTSGLSDYDVGVLIKYLQRLVDKGHSIIVVEHHIGVLQVADYLIELGPGAADLGGQVIFQGSVKNLNQCSQSVIKEFV